jgi:hypothetical protein
MSSTDKDKKLSIPDASFPPVSVSFYYAEKDRAFCETLSHHLTPLERNGRIHTWDERQILAGQVRDQELKDHLSTDRILILLVSIDFLVSDIWERQRQMILQRHHKGDVTVIPILIRSCSLQGTGLEIFPILPQQLLSQNGFRSLTDEVWQEVATEISQVIDAIQPWVFVASAPGDEDFVARLHHDLAPSHVRLFSDFDQHNEMDMRDIMRSTPIVLLIASPLTTSSSFVIDQMNLVADYNRPVLIVWAKGEDWEQPDPKSWLAETVFDARVERYETALTALVERLKRQKKRVSPLPTERFLPKEVRNPYKGLSAFTEKDARDFFGRETLIDELTGVVTQILAEDMQGQRSSRLLTVLLGASGSGKSSVVMAGLLPFLQRKGISNSKEWIYLDRMVPGKNPLRELADSLVQQPVFRNKYTGLSLQHDLATSDSLLELHHLARELVGSSSRKVVLFIDQFEEVFTSAAPEERARFFEILTAAVTEPRGPLLVLLTLRADFYDRPMQYLTLYNLLEAHRVAVLPMKREDLRRIIEEPAQLPDVQLTFEGDLVGDLLFDVRDQDASLPLLQFTLEQLFLRRKGRQLTLQAYRDIGGVKGALVKHAEETYVNLPSEEHQKLAQTLFGRLINVGATPQDATRRRTLLSEFEQPDPRLTELLRETREAFITARLLTTNEVAGTVIVEVSHEALIREWPRCTTWIKEARENFPFQEALSKDVAQWEQLGHPKERLYRGSQLKTTRKKIDPTFLNQQEVRFLRVSAVNQRQQWIRLVALVLIPMIVLGLVLTPVLVLRPSWCPSWLCPAPKVVPLLAKGGIHDSNLQVTFQTLQSYFKILPVAPSAYTLGTSTPNDAQLIDTSQSLPYHVVLKIHSLQLGRYGLAIDQVGLLINKQTQEIPYPLRIVFRTDMYTYDNNLYQVTYRGQEPGAQLSALYMPVPLGFVSLVPGETDEISLEVRSTVVVDLRFQVQVIYHVIGDLASHTLLLPNIFEVVFSDPANWHPYQIQSGHLVATS